MVRLGIVAFLAVTALCVVAAIPAKANGGPVGDSWEEINADALVAHCRAISRQDRDSGVTSRMRAGTLKTVECLKDEVVRQAAALIDPEVMDAVEIRETVESLSWSYMTLYWSVYNDRRVCSPTCGTIYHTFHVGRAAGLFEEILRRIIAQRNADRK